MTYRGLGFDGDNPQMYKELRESITKIYQDVDVKIFGPVNVTDFNENMKSNVDQTKQEHRNDLERGERTQDKR